MGNAPLPMSAPVTGATLETLTTELEIHVSLHALGVAPTATVPAPTSAPATLGTRKILKYVKVTDVSHTVLEAA
jgi:hypothetical protein